MNQRVVYTNENPDLMYAGDLASQLIEANDAAYDLAKAEGEDAPFFFVQDQDGRAAQGVKITEDTLSDGSKAYTVVVTFEH